MKLVVEMMVAATTKCLFRPFSLQKNGSRILKVDVPTLGDILDPSAAFLSVCGTQVKIKVTK